MAGSTSGPAGAQGDESQDDFVSEVGAYSQVPPRSWQSWRPALPSRLDEMTGTLTVKSPEILEQVARERDLYKALMELTEEVDPEQFLRHALELIVGGASDTRGYLELFDPNHLGDGGYYSVGFPEHELATVKTLVSHGIIAEAIASERVIATPSAVLDPRFRDRASVKQSGIDAVICAPIGKNPPRGVLYVQTARPSKDVLEEQAARIELIARHLAPIAEQVISRRRMQGSREVSELRDQLKAEEFVGTSASLLRLLQEVQAVANFDISVLLSGETGTGKSQLARLIHRNSRRANGPFIELNCAALPEHLVESELFGAMPGAHSTAARRIEGKVSAAAQGTLLLDEIAELSLPSQAKLLQLLQSKEYFPLGASRSQHADVRIIAASNVDLSEAVAEKRFRQDLYYRLQVLSIRLPTLAERRQDAALLAQYFCRRVQKVHGLPDVSLSPAALRAVESTEWPGNVRELAHRIEAAAIRAAGERLRQIEIIHLFPDSGDPSGNSRALTFQEETRRFQTTLLERTLESCDWNVSEAARRLDLTRAHVYNLIKSFKLQR